MPARSGEVRSLRTLEYVLGADPAVVRGFATAASDRLGQGPLTLEGRDLLLRRGQRLGLRRFDANLVLAAVEQRTRHRNPPELIAKATSERRFTWPTAAVAIAVQLAIVTGAWWLLA